jgi:tetraacyldisaccharide 4'-kinase
LQRKKQVLSRESIADQLKIGLQSTWYKRGLLSFLISVLLWPLSQFYKFLAFTHRKLYQTGIFKVHTVSVPVIALMQHLQAQGVRVGVVSRGYGRTSDECLQVKADSKVSDVGDEPCSMLLAQNPLAHPAPVFVAKSRFEAASALLKTYPSTQVIISDDGLQHHALQHDIAVTVFDDRGVGNGLLLPAGPLRESAVKTYNSLVLHTGNHAVKLTNTAAPQFTTRRALASYALRSDGSKVNLDALKPQTKLVALAGIANPAAFFEMLRSKGINLAKTLEFPDHYAFNSTLGSEYAGYNLICTLKDAVKLWLVHPEALAVPLAFAPEPAFFTAFDDLLKPLLATNSPT